MKKRALLTGMQGVIDRLQSSHDYYVAEMEVIPEPAFLPDSIKRQKIGETVHQLCQDIETLRKARSIISRLPK